MPLISVIIPCYNVEGYIDRCLETVVNQTIGIDNLEVILVNDASTDHTLDKLEEWEKRFPENIMVVTYEENMRQGGARNIGLQYANADYIGFVDSDDWLELDMYETLYEPMKRGGYDVVQGKCIREHYPSENPIDNSAREDQTYIFEKIDGFYKRTVNNYGNVGECGGIWSCLYSKKCIFDNNVFFPEHIAYEDNYWGSMLQLYVGSLYVVDKIVYHYFINMQSTVTARNAVHQLERLDIEIAIIEEYRRIGAFDIFYKELEWGFIKRFYLNTMYIIFVRFDYIPDIFGFMKEKILEYFPNYMENDNIEGCTAREKQLLRLLEIPGDITPAMLERVKAAYLKTY